MGGGEGGDVEIRVGVGEEGGLGSGVGGGAGGGRGGVEGFAG